MTSIFIDSLVDRYSCLSKERLNLEKAYELLELCYESHHKLLISGNGGSASDAEHIVGELMKSFVRPRPISEELTVAINDVCGEERGAYLSSRLETPLTAIALTTHEALTTAYSNDVDSSMVYAQQLLGYGRRGDVLLAISTSGNSSNIINAAILAKAMGIKVIALTGGNGGELKDYSDVSVIVPETETYKIQELHLPIYHCLCMMLEERFF